MKLIYVQWQAAAARPEAIIDRDELFDDLEPLTVYAVGWLLHETDDYIALVSRRTEDGGELGGHVTVPRGAIVEIYELEWEA